MILVISLILSQMNVFQSYAVTNEISGLKMKVVDAEGNKPEYNGKTTILTDEKDINLNGDASVFFEAKGTSMDLTNIEYTFFKQETLPNENDFNNVKNWNKVNYREFINGDVVKDEPGYLTWRSYNVAHMATMSNKNGSWSNRANVYKNPNNKIQFQSTKTSKSVEEYIPEGKITKSVFMIPMDIGVNGGPYPNYKEASKFWGYIKPSETGTYYFGINSDDGSYGYIIDNSGKKKEIVSGFFYPHGSKWGTKNVPVKLTAGKYYPIYLEYFNWGGSAHFELYYNKDCKVSNNNKKVVPENWFYPSRTDEPGEISESTFEIDYKAKFPTEPGTYYIGVKSGNKKGIYGPFKVFPKAPINMVKEVEKNQFLLNEEFTINYKIQPQPIPSENILPESYLKDKEIVLVMDTSGSMAWDIERGGGSGYTWDNNGNKVHYYLDSKGDIIYYRRHKIKYDLYKQGNEVYYKDYVGNIIKPRITIAKKAAKNFVEKFKGNEKVKIALVPYDSYAKDVTFNNGDFANLSDENQYQQLINKINSLQPDGGTNIGDGLRKAYYKFSNSNQNTRKYVILMTDGEPTFHSYIVKKFDWGDGSYYYDYYLGYGSHYYIDGGGNYTTDEDREYANKVAKDLILNGEHKIDSFMIAFSNDADKNELKNIANSAKGYYKEAIDGNALDEVYQKLAKQIQSDLPIRGINFKEIFPQGINIVSASKGLKIDGQTVTGDIGSISYRLNKQTNQFEAEPFEFFIKVKPTKTGDYTLGKCGNDDSTSYIDYEDIDGSDGHKEFPGVDISVYEKQPPDISANLKNHKTDNDKYNLDLTIDEPAKIEIFNADRYLIWKKDREKNSNQYPKTFSIDINKSDVNGNYITIKAQDKFDNVVEETVPLIKLKPIEIKSYAHEIIKGILDIETQKNSTITSVKINGIEVIKNDVLTNNGEYRLEEVDLKENDNEIEISVKNYIGNTATLKFNRNIEVQEPIEVELGILVNKEFKKESQINLVKGYSLNLAISIKNIKNQEVVLEIGDKNSIEVSEIEVYEAVYDEDKISIGNKVDAKINKQTYKIILPKVDNYKHYIIVYKTKAKIDAKIGSVVNKIKIDNNLMTSSVINIVELPNLE
ncbi:PA14 domain-containing protein [Tepidibacter thalassicus DSM 15285]|uniref:PA14 domain-containing protein n=1 Tax=Tepidibacter thalassicus DSM 15285 TaxID=1123350 RepID=A0A1M5PNQ6_9FIRM|nr:PA14 domain-containing protein [Tepidibacter thalassicus DSM 15285]